MDELSDFASEPLRPQFLKILCILTFIGSGYLVCSGLFNYFNADRATKLLAQTQMRGSNSKKDSVHRNNPPVIVQNILRDLRNSMTPSGIRNESIYKVVSGILCILGAASMWKLKKYGYFLYVFGVVIGIAAPFYLFGNNSYVILTSIFSGFIGILFIIFYGMNFGSLK